MSMLSILIESTDSVISAYIWNIQSSTIYPQTVLGSEIQHGRVDLNEFLKCTQPLWGDPTMQRIHIGIQYFSLFPRLKVTSWPSYPQGCMNCMTRLLVKYLEMLVTDEQLLWGLSSGQPSSVPLIFESIVVTHYVTSCLFLFMYDPTSQEGNLC